ncbi:DUF6313 family protein [Streptomyces rectiviolaceus]
MAAWWERRHALGRLPYWLLTRAIWLLTPCAGLFILNGALMGWTAAYEVLLGITSPAAADPQWAAWLLSVAGWAAMPALIGGAAGYVISAQIQSHQNRDIDEVVAQLINRSRSSSDEEEDGM